ncbi:DUF6520 family protein [Sinomicrobium sp. M5D2P17]
MKKFRFIMPALALVFAIATAFATAKIDPQGDGWYKDAQDVCQQEDLDLGPCDTVSGTNCTITVGATTFETVYATQDGCDDELSAQILRRQ